MNRDPFDALVETKKSTGRAEAPGFLIAAATESDLRGNDQRPRIR
jgi:hypothetical protein